MRPTVPASRALTAYAAALERVFPWRGQVDATVALLREGRADAEARALDAHLRQADRFVSAVGDALAPFDERDLLALRTSRPVPAPPDRPRDALVDAIAAWVSEALADRPVAALELAVATGRLAEESRALSHTSRLLVPLGRGFEQRLEDRLRLRCALPADRRDELLAAVEAHRDLLLEAPGEGAAAIQETIARSLAPDERAWLEAERFAGMLHIARDNHTKTEGGHIRRFLRRDEKHGVVADRCGAHGHWLVAGGGEASKLVRAGTVAARALGEDREATPDGWRALIVDGAPAAEGGRPIALDEAVRAAEGAPDDAAIRRSLSPLDPARAAAAIRAATRVGGAPDGIRPRLRPYTLSADEDGLTLAADAAAEPLARVALDPDDDALLDFLDTVDRVGDAVVDAINDRHGDADAVQWVRALLANRPDRAPAVDPDDLAGLDVRLVYVPASQPHPLGGLPMIGLRFLADGLERAGARADVLTLLAQDVERRLDELLDADVIGLSVYLTNREEVAKLVDLLRAAGFAGRLVLGGPELREIDLVQREVPGWDALIRGEGEEAFPDVLRVLRHLDAGNLDEALERARALRGVVVAHGGLAILADTAARNAAVSITCPLPFEWRRYADAGVLKMNFTRGCPYQCGFCPNHQGQKYHSCGGEEMWAFTRRAAADALRLPRAEEERLAGVVQDALGVAAAPRLRPALHVLTRGPVRGEVLARLCPEEPPDLPAAATPWEAKRLWLEAKAAWLPLVGRAGGPSLERFELMTSEDNTLVNDDDVLDFMRRRRQSGLAELVVFNPGQNTVRDLTDRQGGLNAELVDVLCDANPFSVVLGVDGTSNPVLRQNHKPFYGIGDALAVNRALVGRGATVLNNYILLAPETDLLEAIEAIALFVALPLQWRNHGPAINLRIIKEPGTRFHDEGLLFAPEDEGYCEPFRFPEVGAFVERWALTPAVHSAHLPALLWWILAEDEDAARLLPQVVRRWERDFDGEPALVALAARVRAASLPGQPMVAALRRAAESWSSEWPADLVPEERAITLAKPRRPRRGAPAPQRALK